MHHARLAARWLLSRAILKPALRSKPHLNAFSHALPSLAQPRITTTIVFSRGIQNDTPPRRRWWQANTISEGRRREEYDKLMWMAIIIGILFVYGSWTEEDERVFNPPSFTTCEVIDTELVSPTSFVLTLRPKLLLLREADDPYRNLWKGGPWAVEIKQPELQIARSYTPLPPIRGHSPDTDTGSFLFFRRPEGPLSYDLRFLIRIEPDGEVSRYLQRLPIDAKVEVRGPQHTATLPPSLQEVVFIAGGTGIAPALQVAHTILEARREVGPDAKESKIPVIHIIWANRRQEDCIGAENCGMQASLGKADEADSEVVINPIVQYLQDLEAKHPGHLHVDYTVDEEGTYIDRRTILKITDKSLKAVSPANAASTASVGAQNAQAPSKMIYVSGPDGFVNYIAGPKVWADGEQKQGPLGGLLRRTNVLENGWGVWKF